MGLLLLSTSVWGHCAFLLHFCDVVDATYHSIEIWKWKQIDAQIL
jgi:hypothetical protein